MLNKDPEPTIEATSWRISLDACLISTEVLRQLGGISPEFETLEGAALEMGHRYITRGAIVRHVPNLISQDILQNSFKIPLIDELRFIRYRFRGWSYYWVLFRILWRQYANPRQAIRLWLKLLRAHTPA